MVQHLNENILLKEINDLMKELNLNKEDFKQIDEYVKIINQKNKDLYEKINVNQNKIKKNIDLYFKRKKWQQEKR